MLDLTTVTDVWYHANCTDGYVAASGYLTWMLSQPGEHIIKEEKRCTKVDNVTFTAYQYGTDAPSGVGKRILIVDFSFPLQTINRLITETEGNILIIDHHKTAEEALEDIHDDYKIFDMSQCGSVLTWIHLVKIGLTHPEDKFKELLDYTNDYDLWNEKSNREWKAFNLGFNNLTELRLVNFSAFIKGELTIDQILERGRILKAQQDVYIANTAKKVGYYLAKDPLNEGKTIIVAMINTTIFTNELADYILKLNLTVDVYAGFTIDAITTETQFSLRSRGYLVNRLAEHLVKYSSIIITGGGHEKSAACRANCLLSQLPLKYIDTKILALLIRGEQVMVSDKDKQVALLKDRFPNLNVVTDTYVVVRNNEVVYNGSEKFKTESGDIMTILTGNYGKTIVIS
jgi:oligoribonuclease NrnB/cAMP/cGMP phosphodiesterase (DHH superfamily)